KNLCTTVILDRMAEDFGEKCIEVPVGFKWVSSAIDQYNAVLGGESSGGLTIRGHIHGKDAIYAASLVIEMVSVMGMSIDEISDMIDKKYGRTVFVEKAVRFKPEDKARVNKAIMEDKRIPYFVEETDKVSYMDGCKVYFKDGSFVSCRFSGTEPLLRFMAESDKKDRAEGFVKAFEILVGEILAGK
ncbi:MAG: phosphoglucomutase/phosphomannomutase family protein, partial [Spirochaetales bacterium]|nr:phosphoglucomutase/phosphomannomutase family protein [Spirochaetales bacterium]